MKGNVVTPEKFRSVSRQVGLRTFGMRIQRCRGQTRRSVLEAARRGGIGPDVWAEVEGGRIPEVWKLLEALAKGLGISPAEMASMARQCHQLLAD